MHNRKRRERKGEKDREREREREREKERRRERERERERENDGVCVHAGVCSSAHLLSSKEHGFVFVRVASCQGVSNAAYRFSWISVPHRLCLRSSILQI